MAIACALAGDAREVIDQMRGAGAGAVDEDRRRPASAAALAALGVVDSPGGASAT